MDDTPWRTQGRRGHYPLEMLALCQAMEVRPMLQLYERTLCTDQDLHRHYITTYPFH